MNDESLVSNSHLDVRCSDLKARCWRSIAQQESDLRELSLRILENPELRCREIKASSWLCNLLGKRGFRIQRRLGGLETAFRATRRHGSGPTICFLAEYDALPEIGHGCGHNLTGPAAAGAAIGVGAAMDKLKGSVCVIGTPAEEFLGREEGKAKLLKQGAFQDIDVAVMMHPHYESRVIGSDLGFIACDLLYVGQTAHAASDPWSGTNALDGVLLTFNNINALRQHLRPEVRVHGIVTDGGQAPNTIPKRAGARLMVRASDPDMLEETFLRVENCAQAGALASGTELQLSRVTTVYNSRINPTLNDLVAANFGQLSESFSEDRYDMSASSDFGSVSQVIPAAMFMVKTHDERVSWHSAEVAAMSGEELALQRMLTASQVTAGVAVDLLSDSDLLAKVWRDFDRDGIRHEEGF